MSRPHPDMLRALAKRADDICTNGYYANATNATISIADALAASKDGTRLISPSDWTDIIASAKNFCATSTSEAIVQVTNESTMQALQRLCETEQKTDVAALNFASARNPGGGYRNGAFAQEETLARSSGLVPTLEQCWTYYDANRKESSLLYTDHAIWSPRVPFFADDAGNMLTAPYCAGIITMPAPNAGAMRSESDLLGLVPTFTRRITSVLALAINQRVRHLVLGAWGCGAFGNHPNLVARLFAEVLHHDQPWHRGFDSVTFAIIDHSQRKSSFETFASTLAPLTI